MTWLKFWIVLAALLLAPCAAQARIALDGGTQRALEGRWESDCRLTVVDDLEKGYSSFSIDFANSGGSVFYSDGVDFAQRGWIVDAARHGRKVNLQLDFSGRIWPLRLRLLTLHRLQSSGSEHFGARVLRRCAAPNRRAVAGVAPALLRRFSKGMFSLLGPESKMDLCARFVNGSLLVDLAGPDKYTLTRVEFPLGEPQRAEYWTIPRARTIGAGLRLDLRAIANTSGVKRQRITLVWIDARHLRAVEWKRTYVHCD